MADGEPQRKSHQRALIGYSLETLHAFVFTEPESVLDLMIPVGCDTNEATTIMRLPLAMQSFLSYMLWIMAHIVLYQDCALPVRVMVLWI